MKVCEGTQSNPCAQRWEIKLDEYCTFYKVVRFAIEDKEDDSDHC